jgi:hypothetical protein
VLHVAAALAPLYGLHKAEVLATGYAGSDDTSVTVLVPGEPGSDTGRFWCALGYRLGLAPLVIFEFTLDRKGANLTAFFAGYRGWLQADAFSGYDALFGLGEAIEVGCWAHARRYFDEALHTPSCRRRSPRLRSRSPRERSDSTNPAISSAHMQRLLRTGWQTRATGPVPYRPKESLKHPASGRGSHPESASNRAKRVLGHFRRMFSVSPLEIDDYCYGWQETDSGYMYEFGHGDQSTFLVSPIADRESTPPDVVDSVAR